METGKPVLPECAESLDLINPDAEFVPAEVDHVMQLTGRGGDRAFVKSVYDDIVRLFGGEYPGYRACNTYYHDLEHTTDTLLAMVRLQHGAVASGTDLGGRSITLGLAAALLHDTGYIQTSDDNRGTGAKYTLTHITRSIDFAREYFRAKGLPEEDFEFCRKCLLCTGLGARIAEIGFLSEEERITGRMLGTADLLGQMADRKYPEKLLYLYHEFREGRVPGYEDERDLLRKTLDFHRMTEARLAGELGNVRAFMGPHFAARWNLATDLYARQIARNIEYIRKVALHAEKDYRVHLRRGGIVQHLREMGW